MCEHKRKTPKRIENKWSPSTGAAKRKLHAFESGLKEKLTMTGTKKKTKTKTEGKTKQKKKKNKTRTRNGIATAVCGGREGGKGTGQDRI